MLKRSFCQDTLGTDIRTEMTLNTVILAADGTVAATRVVCGDEQPQAAMAPRFSPSDGKLYFITDTNGWWNLYREDEV